MVRSISNSNEQQVEEFITTAAHRAAIYARKSLQNDNNSINSQLQEARQILKDENLLLYKTYIDDGVTATTTKIEERKGLNQLLQDALQDKFKTVIVYKSDRLARDIHQAIAIRRIFRQKGIKVIYSSQKAFSIPDGYIGDFTQNILMGLDMLEAKQIAFRIRMGKKNKRLRGEYDCGRSTPLGYKKIDGPVYNLYKPDKINGPLVKAYFDACVGASPSTMDEFVSLAQRVFSDDKIRLTFVRKLIENPIYAGVMLIDTETPLSKAIVPSVNRDLAVECTNVERIVEISNYCSVLSNWIDIYSKRNYTKYEYLFTDELYCHLGCKIVGGSGKYSCKPHNFKNCSECKEKVCNKECNQSNDNTCDMARGEALDKCVPCQFKQCYNTCENRNRECKACKKLKGFKADKDKLELLIVNQIIKELNDASYLKNGVKNIIDNKLKILNDELVELRKQLDKKKLEQKETLDNLISKNSSNLKKKLEELIEKEISLLEKINTKEKRIYSIKSNFLIPEKLSNMTQHLMDNTTRLLDVDNVENTRKYIGLLLERVVIKPIRNIYSIKEIDYGN